jgi:hypothetical protein
VRTKDSCWSVWMIYDHRVLSGVSSARLGIGRGVTVGPLMGSASPRPNSSAMAQAHGIRGNCRQPPPSAAHDYLQGRIVHRLPFESEGRQCSHCIG